MMIQKKNNKSHSLMEKIFLIVLAKLHYYYHRPLSRKFRDSVRNSVRYSAFSKRSCNSRSKHYFQIDYWLLPVACCLLVIISSCKVGKEYQRPALELPNQFSNVSFADTSSIADIEWKNFFYQSRFAKINQ
jgi:hypothetical protein